MKKLLLVLLFLVIIQRITIAQITLQANVPSVGIIQKDQLWNVLVVNGTDKQYDCRLELALQDRITGQEVFTASSNYFSLLPGAKQLNVNILTPIQYNYLNSGADNSFRGLIPIGNYTVCYSLTSIASRETSLAEECIPFDVEALSPPMLIFPADSSYLKNNPTQFSWTAPTPQGAFARLKYDILICEIKSGQLAQEAIEENIPFYSENNLYNNVLNYTSASLPFEKDKWYAWQVIARDEKAYAGKSETWTFKVSPDSNVKNRIAQTPFVKMKKSDPEKGVAPNGVLKISYVNETTDSVAKVEIIDLKNEKKKAHYFTVSLKPGENLIEFNVEKSFSLQKNKVYEARITNSRQETWAMRFEIYNYQ